MTESGSMIFWYGSGSLPLTNRSRSADPDPSIFIIELQDANKKLIFKKKNSAYYFLKVLLHHFSKVKIQKDLAKQ
jgi:hypothetical protein